MDKHSSSVAFFFLPVGVSPSHGTAGQKKSCLPAGELEQRGKKKRLLGAAPHEAETLLRASKKEISHIHFGMLQSEVFPVSVSSSFLLVVTDAGSGKVPLKTTENTRINCTVAAN